MILVDNMTADNMDTYSGGSSKKLLVTFLKVVSIVFFTEIWICFATVTNGGVLKPRSNIPQSVHRTFVWG